MFVIIQINIGLTETPTDKLRSILAQADYTYTVRKWDAEGVPFWTYCYVPERDPITGENFHKRDHTHLLKASTVWLLYSLLL